eukprot:Phypoly_transcript_02187.p1 GENE.Phypoly_transcript_02187~~Phypoly_transcript_02187.p1  ORF type:complete len:799 (+),score=97.06 Phypoly_transcript_02187:348-2744(+)
MQKRKGKGKRLGREPQKANRCIFSHHQHATMQLSQKSFHLSTSLHRVFICICFFLSLSIAALNPTEYAAFMDLYNSMGGETWVNFYNTSADPCSYVLVTCDPGSTTVTRLLLGANNLTGTIHPSIGSFPNAKYITLSSNKLTGPIPDTISQLSSIQRLDLSHNQLTGDVPEVLGTLLTLSELYIQSNQFTSLPNSITSLIKLQVLQADHNQLSGRLPSLVQWPVMRALFLDSNRFTGYIPEFPPNAMLQDFSIMLNSLTGPIPESISNCQNLYSFIANNNSLTGTLPAALTQLPNLWILFAADNFFTGRLPEFTPAMRTLSLSYNQFYGNIPHSLFTLPNTTYVDLTVNHFNGSLPQEYTEFPHFSFSCNAIQSPLCPDCGPCELCGDGFCDLLGEENCATCPQDCGVAPCGVCGDGVCQSSAGESCSSCYIDCGLCAPPPTKTCPGTPVCNGRGTCLPTLICSCDKGFTGPGCESTVQPVIVKPDPGNPTTTITSSTGTAFQVNVKQLTEYNPLGQVVQVVNFTNVPLTLTESELIDSNNVSMHNWTYTGPIPGLAAGAFVTVTIVLYRNATTVEFANETFNLAAQTTKYTLSVRDWPFLSARNTFGITFGAQDAGKGNVCVQSQKDSVGNVQWIKLILPSGDALYPSFFPFLFLSFFLFIYFYLFIYLFFLTLCGFAEFTEIVELDTKIIHGSFDSPSEGAVELRVPHFWDEMVFDPNFSLLVTDLKTSASECFRNHKIANWAIVLIAILGTFGVIAIVLGSIYLHRKLKQMRLVKEAHEAHGITGASSSVAMMRV